MRSLLILLTGLSITLVNPLALAAVPTTMNYQGYLTDASGAAVDATVSITFNVYTTDTGGTALWTSTRSVVVSSGLFSVNLGEIVSFPPDLFDTPLWVGVTIDTDAEMTPRRALTSVGFAFNADQLQGQPASVYDQSSHVSDTSNPHSVTAAQTGALTAADIATLQADLTQALLDIATLQSTVTTLQTTVATNTSSIGNNDIDILNNGNNIAINTTAVGTNTANISANATDVNAVQTQANTNSTDIAANTTSISTNAGSISANTGNIAVNATAIATINTNSVLALDGLLTRHGSDTARFSNVNVQIINGTGSTAGPGNGTGNLLVGYDETDFISSAICSFGEYDNQTDCENNSGRWAVSHKSGSHNVIIGSQHNYSRYGGLVAGFNNDITGASGTVSGGQFNTANGTNSSVSGGAGNIASGNSSSVSGGVSVSASEPQEWQAGTTTSDIVTLQANSVLALDGVLTLDTTDPTRPAALFTGVNVQVVNGLGATNAAPNGTGNVIVGYDEIDPFDAPICSFGQFNSQTACEDDGGVWAISHKSGSHNVVIGKWHNYSRVGGLVLGINNNITGRFAAVSGGTDNTASKSYTSVSGGQFNTAFGDFASVSGGKSNTASDLYSSVSGGENNMASGFSTSVSGGQFNTAFGNFASVSGGSLNIASGDESSVSGGSIRSATGSQDWAAGTLLEDN